MDDSINPFECNMSWTVDFTDEERNFYGKEALLKSRLEKDQLELVGIMLEERAILRQGEKLYLDEAKTLEGIITSGTYSPTLKKPIGLARIPKKDINNCFAEVRGKKIFAKIGNPKFIKEGNRVKFSLRFKGREMEHSNLGIDMLKRVKKDLEELIRVEMEPKIEGRQAILVVAPK